MVSSTALQGLLDVYMVWNITSSCILPAGAGFRARQTEVVRTVASTDISAEQTQCLAVKSESLTLLVAVAGAGLGARGLKFCCACRFTEAERINGRWAMAGCAGVLGQVSNMRSCIMSSSYIKEATSRNVHPYTGVHPRWLDIHEVDGAAIAAALHIQMVRQQACLSCRSFWECSQSGSMLAQRITASLP